MATPGPRLSEKNNNEKRYLSAIGTISERSAAKRGGDNDSRARAQEQPKCEPRQGDLAEGAQKWLQNAAALDDKHFASSADAPQVGSQGHYPQTSPTHLLHALPFHSK